MSLRISLTTHAFNAVVCPRLQAHDIPKAFFLEWKAEAEFDLEKNASSKLRFVSGRDSYHEYVQPSVIVQGRKFKVIWELEWQRSEDKLALLDLRIVRVPVIPKNPEID